MKIGLNTDGFGHLPLDKCLDQVAELGIKCVEFGMGGWSSAPHANLDELLADPAARDRFLGMVRERGLEISALNCSANQLHPVGRQDC